MAVLSRPTASADAVILRIWPTGETSVIASIVTREFGYVRVIAKGARGERSLLRPLVQPGRLVNVEFSLRPDRDLQYLKGGQVLLDAQTSGGGLERTAYLLAAVEIADRCRPGGERDSNVFILCCSFLQMLSSQSPGDAGLFYAFEFNLLDLHGVGPELHSCANCGRGREDGLDRGARFCPDEGGVVCRRCIAEGSGRFGRPLSRDAYAFMLGLDRGDGDVIKTVATHAALRREVGIHLHGFLQYHVPTYRLPAALELLRQPTVGDRRAEAREDTQS